MSMNKHKEEEEEEVEQLLKQAEDDVFLRLNLNSHTTKQHLLLPSSSLSLPSSSSSSSSHDPLDDELARRLASLKAPAKNPQTQLPEFGETQLSKLGKNQEGFSGNPKTQLPKHGENPEDFGAEDGLNYGLLKRFESLKGSMKRVDVEGLINLGGGGGIGGGGLRSEEDEDFETEVNKLIEWAKDAARLDPSPNEEEEEDDDEEEEEEVGSKKDKGKRVEKGT